MCVCVCGERERERERSNKVSIEWTTNLWFMPKYIVVVDLATFRFAALSNKKGKNESVHYCYSFLDPTDILKILEYSPF